MQSFMDSPASYKAAAEGTQHDRRQAEGISRLETYARRLGLGARPIARRIRSNGDPEPTIEPWTASDEWDSGGAMGNGESE